MITTDETANEIAATILKEELRSMDLAASRFRDDSELSRLNNAAGSTLNVSALFCTALQTALRAARLTCGALDPTIGEALKIAGYDRSFDTLGVVAHGTAITVNIKRVPGWQAIDFDARRRLVRLPKGVALDLGATAKALAADLAAARIAAELGIGVLVNLGGDIALAGEAPDGGWLVDVADSHTGGPVHQTVAVYEGGLATSSTTVRHWNKDGKSHHHIIDPKTSQPAEIVWRIVSTTAASCVDANIASTASIVKGEDAVEWLSSQSVDARLVRADGTTVFTGRWPKDERE